MDALYAYELYTQLCKRLGNIYIFIYLGNK